MFVVALGVAACGTRVTPPTASSGDGARSTEVYPNREAEARGEDADVDGRRPGECPARYAQPGPRCVGGDAPEDCAYPEGVCSCDVAAWCVGPAPPPDRAAEWICRRPRPPCHTAGTACTGSASCSFDPCGWRGVRCEGGVWTAYATPVPG